MAYSQPPSTTRSFGKDDNLNAEQVKEQIAQNPELTPGERQQNAEKSAGHGPGQQSARGRHLGTTGQQSVRGYPFNAKDYLALIKSQGVEKSQQSRKKPKGNGGPRLQLISTSSGSQESGGIDVPPIHTRLRRMTF